MMNHFLRQKQKNRFQFQNRMSYEIFCLERKQAIVDEKMLVKITSKIKMWLQYAYTS